MKYEPTKSLASQKYPLPGQRGRLRKLKEFLTNERSYRHLLLRHYGQVAHAIWLQFRSLPLRIVFLWSKNLDHFPAYGPLFDLSQQFLALNKQTQARISDTQYLMGKMKWPTPLDCWFFLEGWKRGEEFGRNAERLYSDSQQGQSQQVVRPSESPDRQG